MPERVFTKEQLEEWDVRFNPLDERIVDRNRWGILYEIVFRAPDDGKHYRLCYEDGATEYQDSGYGWEDEETGTEVELREVTVKRWMDV